MGALLMQQKHIIWHAAMYIDTPRTSVLVCDLPVGKLTCGSDGKCADKQDNKPTEQLHFSNRGEFFPWKSARHLFSLAALLANVCKNRGARLGTDLSCTTANCGAED